jgi:hypothetical protein
MMAKFERLKDIINDLKFSLWIGPPVPYLSWPPFPHGSFSPPAPSGGIKTRGGQLIKGGKGADSRDPQRVFLNISGFEDQTIRKSSEYDSQEYNP